MKDESKIAELRACPFCGKYTAEDRERMNRFLSVLSNYYMGTGDRTITGRDFVVTLSDLGSVFRNRPW